jgi:hypothetical protein
LHRRIAVDEKCLKKLSQPFDRIRSGHAAEHLDLARGVEPDIRQFRDESKIIRRAPVDDIPHDGHRFVPFDS